MTVKVLVVDDSGFFRRRLCDIINAHPNLNVIGTAVNGREAVQMALDLNPDVITMDYEMPIMDGISAVREIVSQRRIPVLMFSSLTYEGARVTLDALEAGAVDYLPKNLDDISRSSAETQKVIHDRIIAVSESRPRIRTRAVALDGVSDSQTRKAVPEIMPQLAPVRRQPAIVVIGASTGGPVALQQVLSHLPADFPIPVLAIQHMPATFTRAFAERLNRLCAIKVTEASDGDRLAPGNVYLAPGGRQMLINSRNKALLRVIDGEEGNARVQFRPSLNVTFGSAAQAFGSRVLGIVLTGMGSDGREGAKMLKSAGSRVWVQDERSCVIYGMPLAVIRANLADEVYDLREIGPHLLQQIKQTQSAG